MLARGLIQKKLNKILKSKLNEVLNDLEIGKVTSLKVNLKTKSAIIRLYLKGESEEIVINIKNISCKREKGKWKLNLPNVEVSKEWMEILLLKNLENMITHPKLLNLLNNKTILGFKIGQLCNAVF